MTLRYRLLLLYLRLFRRPNLRSKNRLHKRIRQDAKEDRTPPASLHDVLDVTHRSMAGTEVWTLSPKCAQDSPRVHVMYLHGGAFVFGITQHHWRFIARMVTSTGATVHVVLYPRAPACQHHESLAAVESVYGTLRELHPGQPMLLMGDSAGATLCLLLSSRLKQQADGLVLISPCADLSLASPGVKEMEDRDPWLTAEGLQHAFALWLGDTPSLDPSVNPMTCDLSGLPPTHLFIGDRDIFWPDCMRLAEKLQRERREIRVHVGEDMVHAWPILPIAEARSAEQSIHALTQACGAMSSASSRRFSRSNTHAF